MKKFKVNNLLKIMSLNSVSVIVSLFLGVLSARIISHHLGSSGMALFGSFRNFTTMIKSLSTLGLNNAVIKVFKDNSTNEKEQLKLYTSFFWLFFFLSLFFSILLFVFSRQIAKWIFYNVNFNIYIQFFATVLPFLILNVLWTSIYNSFERFNRIIFIQIISNIIIFLFTVYLIWNNSLQGGLFSIAIGELFCVIITFILFKMDFKFEIKSLRNINYEYYDVVKKFSIMALLSALIGPGTLIIIRNIIVENYSVQTAGLWDAITRISSFYMVFMNTGLTMYYLPKLSTVKSKTELKNELSDYFKKFVPFFLLLLIILFFIKDFIINVLFTSSFYEIKDYLLWQFLGDLFRIMSLGFGFHILMNTMIKRYFIIEIVFNLLYIILSVTLMKFYEIEGVVISYSITSLIIFFIMIYFYRDVLFSKKIID